MREQSRPEIKLTKRNASDPTHKTAHDTRVGCVPRSVRRPVVTDTDALAHAHLRWMPLDAR